MKLVSSFSIFGLALFLLGALTSPGVAQESRWGSPDEETVQFIEAVETKWANSACSPQPDLKDLLRATSRGRPPRADATARRRLSPPIQSLSRATANWAR